jgi:hypothetical protein
LGVGQNKRGNVFLMASLPPPPSTISPNSFHHHRSPPLLSTPPLLSLSLLAVAMLYVQCLCFPPGLIVTPLHLERRMLVSPPPFTLMDGCCLVVVAVSHNHRRPGGGGNDRGARPLRDAGSMGGGAVGGILSSGGQGMKLTAQCMKNNGGT